MKSKFRKITSCRLCQSKALNSFVDFGCVPLGNNLEPNLDSSSNADEFPLEVVRCKKCSHFQLSCAVNPKLLYARNYTYLSGIGKSFLKHMEKYANWIEKITADMSLVRSNQLFFSPEGADASKLSYFIFNLLYNYIHTFL